MRLALSVVMAAPVERVFAFLAEPDERPRWQSSLRRVERLTEGEPRLGTRWRERPLGLGWVELEIIAFERDRVWTERAELAIGTFTLTLRFAPENGHTRVDVEADRPPGTREAARPRRAHHHAARLRERPAPRRAHPAARGLNRVAETRDHGSWRIARSAEARPPLLARSSRKPPASPKHRVRRALGGMLAQCDSPSRS